MYCHHLECFHQLLKCDSMVSALCVFYIVILLKKIFPISFSFWWLWAYKIIFKWPNYKMKRVSLRMSLRQDASIYRINHTNKSISDFYSYNWQSLQAVWSSSYFLPCIFSSSWYIYGVKCLTTQHNFLEVLKWS